MFIDTHIHLDTFEEQAHESFENLLSRFDHGEFEKPEAFFHIACDPKGFDYGIKIAEKYSFVYTAIGIHPEYTDTETSNDETKLRNLLNHPKVIACGEFGLDYHYRQDNKEKQKKLFHRHIQIGLDSQKTLMLHLREADSDALSILKQYDLRNTNVHIHCFTGSPDFIKELLKLQTNLFIGFTGIITFKNAPNVREAAALVPLHQVLLETDGPYMAPHPYRGKPCHSGYIPYIAKTLADVKKVPLDVLYKKCRENTKRCYGI